MVTLESIESAQRCLRGVAVRTPLLRWTRSKDDAPVYLKLENLQPVGSFKLRGAHNRMAMLSHEAKELGVVAYSAGNHAQGVALAGRTMGVHTTIIMPSNAPKVKLKNTQDLGAEVLEVEGESEERRLRAEELAFERGYTLIPPYDDEAVIAGQGTIGLEILEDLPNVGMVFVPIGGGGLISGIAAALKFHRPTVRVIGVESEADGDARASLRSGRIVELPTNRVHTSVADDALGVQRLGDITFLHMRRFVDDVVTVGENEIRTAVASLALNARIVAEPGGAIAFAAYTSFRDELPSNHSCVAIVSGGNVDPDLLCDFLMETHGQQRRDGERRCG